eukprot:m.318993 g.318993  ORF g.318993 m.318993 type:complete len:52 (+) comp27581_c0_seq20:516-671(+)
MMMDVHTERSRVPSPLYLIGILLLLLEFVLLGLTIATTCSVLALIQLVLLG